MAKIMRHLVSKKKRRFEWGEFDLDLTYITDRIVAMGFPSESLEGLYRNNMKDVQKFFESLHPNRHRIYNLCSERKYDHSKFAGNVAEFPFDDHGPPNLDVIEQFCLDVMKWLDANPENVIGVHCKAGKGRTGTLVSCYLIYSGYCKSASEACRLFGNKRTINGKGITIPSQFRYVRYFEQMLQQSKPPPSPMSFPSTTTLVLNTILMYGVPNFNIGGGCEPYLGISQRDKSVYASKPLKIKKGTEIVEFDCGETILSRDVKIQFFNKSSKGKMFSLCFHTGYVSGNRLKLRRLELDRANKDAAHKHFSPHFVVELVFSPLAQVSKDTQSEVAGAPPVINLIFVCASCTKPISSDDASVHHMDRNWHWGCMTCTICHQGLKDDMIFDKEGRPVCSTCDKSTGFFKFCSACGLLINSHVSEDLGDASYHKECFECSDCGKYLNTVRFITTTNKKLICEPCLTKPIEIPHPPESPKPTRVPTPPLPEPISEPITNGHIHKEPEPEPEPEQEQAPVPEPPKPEPTPPSHVTHSRACPGCQRDVQVSDDRLVALGTMWHRRCFACAQCRKPFVGGKYYIRNDEGYCEECDSAIRLALLSKCIGCGEFIEDAELTEALGGMWHLDCFVCFHCKNPIGGPFASRDGRVYCKPDYENLFCLRCHACTKIVQGSFFRALDKAYHLECFQCIKCGNNLVTGQYFELLGKPCCITCKEVAKFGTGKSQSSTSPPTQSKFLCEHRTDSFRQSKRLSRGNVKALDLGVESSPPSTPPLSSARFSPSPSSLSPPSPQASAPLRLPANLPPPPSTHLSLPHMPKALPPPPSPAASLPDPLTDARESSPHSPLPNTTPPSAGFVTATPSARVSLLASLPPPPRVSRGAFITAKPSLPTRQLSLSGGITSSPAVDTSHNFLTQRTSSSRAIPTPSSPPSSSSRAASPPLSSSPSPSSPPPVPRLLRSSPIATPQIPITSTSLAASPPSSPTHGHAAMRSPPRATPPASPGAQGAVRIGPPAVFRTASVANFPPSPSALGHLDPTLQRHNSDMSLIGDHKSEDERVKGPTWQPDQAALTCPLCLRLFTFYYRKHHCRACGKVVCSECSSKKCKLPALKVFTPTRVCDNCYTMHQRKRRSLSMSHIQHHLANLPHPHPQPKLIDDQST